MKNCKLQIQKDILAQCTRTYVLFDEGFFWSNRTIFSRMSFLSPLMTDTPVDLRLMSPSWQSTALNVHTWLSLTTVW